LAYTPGDASMIAATMARLQKASLDSAVRTEAVLAKRTLHPLEAVVGGDLGGRLLEEGVVRVDKVLPAAACDACLAKINELLLANAEGCFGNVLSRSERWDMYLKNEGLFGDALVSMLGEGSVLGGLFEQLWGKQLPVRFHEFSALVSDLGAIRQPIHPDSQFTDICPLYTVFVALQDVTSGLGPTTFLPNTHTEECHGMHKCGTGSVKDDFLAAAEYR